MPRPRSSEPPTPGRTSPGPLLVDVATPGGPARVHVHTPSPEPVRAVLVLGHGAGGGVDAPDLVAVTDAMVGLGWRVLLVEQPWRVAGRRVAPAPARLDEAWLAVFAAPAVREVLARPAGAPLVIGGRSAGARVACRTAGTVGADRVVCLAFPLHPPGKPERSRADELDGAAGQVPVLVVQGERDPFGRPVEFEPSPARNALPGKGIEVVAVPGDHGLKVSVDEVSTAVVTWLTR